MLYKFYIGLNDKDEHIQVISNATAIKIIKKEFIAATITLGFGIWMDEVEPCLVVDIIDSSANESNILNKMDVIKEKLNQDCIMMVKFDTLKEELI